jgi:uncharacterized Zn-binding protein involved in type VI secretion
VPSIDYPTIQTAVDEPTCLTVLLAAGSFAETVTLHRSLSIQGPGQDQTSIQGDGVRSVFSISGPAVVMLEGMTVQGGRGSSGGGLNIVNAAVRVDDARFTGHATSVGGAIYVQDGWLSLTRVTIDENIAFTGGAGIYSQNSAVSIRETALNDNEVIGGDGGAIYGNGGALTIDDSALIDNQATLGGGIYSGGPLTVTHSLIARNQGNNGGAIINYGPATIDRSILTDNHASFGGAVTALGDLTITFSTLKDNQANAAGAIGLGARLTLTHSTLSGNLATSGNGGALLIGVPARAPEGENSVTLHNVTLSGNAAQEAGGALHLDSLSHAVFVENSTFTANNAALGGGLSTNVPGAISLHNSLVVSNPGGDCAGSLTSLGYNMDGDDTCHLTAPGDLPLTDPLLAPLTSNGGPTHTHALQLGSPAIDQGDPVQCPADDQRGFARPKDGDDSDGPACDMGAYEYFVFDWWVYLPLLSD